MRDWNYQWTPNYESWMHTLTWMMLFRSDYTNGWHVINTLGETIDQSRSVTLAMSAALSHVAMDDSTGILADDKELELDMLLSRLSEYETA